MKKGLIVSCQSEEGSSFNNIESIVNFAIEAERGGAVGLRLRDRKNVVAVSKACNLPITGLTKSEYENGNVHITPTSEEASTIISAGANYVAMDATGRNGYKEIKKASEQNPFKIVGDIANINQAENAIHNGCHILTTALSGYTSECKVNMDEPDYKLLEELVKNFPLRKIVAEGRYWERDQVKKAFDLGAYNVVVGTAITRPHLITKRLMEAYNE